MPEHTGKGEIEKTKSIKLTAELMEDGNLKVECPMLTNQMFMLGLLEQVKLAVIQHNVAIRQSKIQKPQGSIINFMRNKRF